MEVEKERKERPDGKEGVRQDGGRETDLLRRAASFDGILSI